MKQTYLNSLHTIMKRYYLKLDGVNKADAAEEAYINGYLDAGVNATLVTHAELQDIIDRAHFEVFGMSINERRQKLALSGHSPRAWETYDSPAWKRKK